jgi:CDP-2,3-bis-(O-geranylgeranyl)-sn-glycerol synthase
MTAMPLPAVIDVPALALLIAANSTPVIASRLMGARFAAPLDAHVVLRDGRPLFGSHKTWRGLLAGVFASALVSASLGAGLRVGAAFGALSLAGDLCSSFVKRRLNRESGEWSPLLDQVPEALLPLLVFKESLGLDPKTIVGTTFAFTILDLIVTKLRLPLLQDKSAQ